MPKKPSYEELESLCKSLTHGVVLFLHWESTEKVCTCQPTTDQAIRYFAMLKPGMEAAESARKLMPESFEEIVKEVYKE